MDAKTENELQFSGSLGGFDRLKSQVFLWTFILLTIMVFLGVFLLINGFLANISITLGAVSCFIIAVLYYAILGRGQKIYYTITKNEISMWHEITHNKKIFDKTRIKWIAIKNNYISIRIRQNPMAQLSEQGEHLILSKFFESDDEYQKLIDFFNKYYSDKVKQ